jgi:hypothetical protein
MKLTNAEPNNTEDILTLLLVKRSSSSAHSSSEGVSFLCNTGIALSLDKIR